MLRGVRETYAQIEGRAAPFYGLASALGVALPLLVGALTGHAAAGSIAALGAFLVAFTAPTGPYGSRARALATAVAVVSIGATFGGVLSGRPWLAVAVVPLVVIAGIAVPWLGPIAALAVLLTAIRPSSDDVFFNGFLELLGGVLVSALFLVAWPARRLRPLREALADAADAVGATLDAVAQDIGTTDDAALKAVDLTDPDLAAVVQKPDWEEQRRAASRALVEARSTYGLYRADRDNGDQPTQPERLIEALARILHETVALRAQTEALNRGSAGIAGYRSWELDVRVAITALAARLRLLAGGVGISRPTPLGSPDSAAVRRLARQSERMWQAGAAAAEAATSTATTDAGTAAASTEANTKPAVSGTTAPAAVTTHSATTTTGAAATSAAGTEANTNPAVSGTTASEAVAPGATSGAAATAAAKGTTDAGTGKAATEADATLTAPGTAASGAAAKGRGHDEAMVVAALIGQVRRSIDRIARTVESARRIVAGDLRIGLVPPWRAARDLSLIPATPRPRSAWGRLSRAARTGSPMFRQVARVGLVVALAMAVSTAFHLPHGHWLTITVLLSLRGTYGETVARVVQRIAGTAVGAVIAAVLLTLAPSQVGAALIIFVCGLAAFTLRSVNYIFWAVFGTPLVMMLLDFSTPSDWTAAGVRIALTIAGGVLAWLAARLLWPAGTAQVLPERLARLLSTHAELTRAAAAVVDGAAEGLTRERMSAAERATDDVSDARHQLAHEPLPDTDQIALLRTSVQAAQHVRDHLIAVSRMSREDIDDTGPIAGILDRVADHLEDAAAATRATTIPDDGTGASAEARHGAQSNLGAKGMAEAQAGTGAAAGTAEDGRVARARGESPAGAQGREVPAGDGGEAGGGDRRDAGAEREARGGDGLADGGVMGLDLSDQLADLDDHLSRLARRRRSELSDGVTAEETTPLRRALLQAAGLRYTLRALRADAEELAEASLATRPSSDPGSALGSSGGG